MRTRPMRGRRKRKNRGQEKERPREGGVREKIKGPRSSWRQGKGMGRKQGDEGWSEIPEDAEIGSRETVQGEAATDEEEGREHDGMQRRLGAGPTRRATTLER